MEINMKIDVEYTEDDLIAFVLQDLQRRFDGSLTEKDVKIEVITTENYRAKTWERGRFRARVQKST